MRTEEEEEEERDGSPELRDGASSDIRFYKERAGIFEGSRGGRDGGNPAAGSAFPYVGGGININYVSKGRPRLRVLVILPHAVSRVLRLREFAGASSWD